MVKAKLRLSDRVFYCDQCGFVLDRDLNAARNLARLVDEVVGGTSSPSCGATRNELDGTHVRPTLCGQRVPPREDPIHMGRANAATAR